MSLASWTPPVVGVTTDVLGEEAMVDALERLWARAIHLPASGLDDTADALAALNDAQSDGVPLELGPGEFTVTAPLVTAQSFTQPRVRGAGERATIIESTDNDDIFRLVGGSGQVNGGGISDMTLWGANATGVTILGANGNDVERVRFGGAGPLARGILFSNAAAAGTFTEFNGADRCNFEAGCATHIEYVKSTGDSSFHGSGFRRCRFVQPVGATGPIIKVGAGCLVYNVDWDGTIFGTTAGVAFVRNSSTSPVTATGCLRVETAVVQELMDAASTHGLYYAGELLSLGGGLRTQFGFRQIDRASFNADSSITIQVRPYNIRRQLAAGTTILATALDPGKGATVLVNVEGSDHGYTFLVAWCRHPIASGGNVVLLATLQSNNTSGIGSPTLDVNAGGDLTITHASYSSAFTATVGVSEIGTWYTHPAI